MTKLRLIVLSLFLLVLGLIPKQVLSQAYPKWTELKNQAAKGLQGPALSMALEQALSENPSTQDSLRLLTWLGQIQVQNENFKALPPLLLAFDASLAPLDSTTIKAHLVFLNDHLNTDLKLTKNPPNNSPTNPEQTKSQLNHNIWFGFLGQICLHYQQLQSQSSDSLSQQAELIHKAQVQALEAAWWHYNPLDKNNPYWNWIAFYYATLARMQAQQYQKHKQNNHANEMLLAFEQAQAWQYRSTWPHAQLMKFAGIPQARINEYEQLAQGNNYQSFKALSDSLSRKYPAWGRLIQEQDLPELKRIQKQLPNQSLAIFALPLSPKQDLYIQISFDTLYQIPVPNREQLGQLREQFLKHLQQAPKQNQGQEKAEFIQAAHSLFKLLFPHEQELEKKTIKHWLVLGQNGLLDLPLGLLIPQETPSNTPYQNLNYLLKRGPVQRLSSFSLWLSASDRTKFETKTGRILLYLPLEENPDQLSRVQSLLGNSYFGPSTQEQDLNTLFQERYSFLHLHTPDLSVQELFELLDNNNTRPQFLLLQTEAALNNLASNLKHLEQSQRLGIAGLMLQQWPYNNPEIQNLIINHFYEELYRGKSPAIALQKAQINYLEQAPEEQAHPYYWANWTTYGHSERPLTILHQNRWPVYLIYALLITFGTSFTAWFLTRNNRPKTL